MNSQKRDTVNVLATGVVVVILMSLGLFWARWLCAVQRADLLPQADRNAVVSLPPSLSRTPAGEDPNARAPRYLKATMPQPPSSACLVGLGAPQYIEQRRPGGPRSFVYRWNSQPDGVTSVYYDPALGLLVYEGTENEQRADGTQASMRLTCYAGPEGIGKRPDEKLGRFLAPVAERFVLDPQVVYDRAVRRFFAVDWFHRTVRKGPQLPEDKTYRPVQIRVLAKNLPMPLILPSAPLTGDRRDQALWPAYFWVKDLALVLDASGRIDLLDPQTLHFVGVAGRLMSPASVFGSARQTGPEDVIAYEVSLIGLPGGDGGKEWTYGGCAVATVSRDVAGLRLEVYDASGRSVASDETHVPQYVETADGRIMTQGSIPSAQAAYFRLPGAQVLTLTKFTLESLHPPVLLALSHWAAPHVEATAGYRSIFLLPDSFVAMSARDVGIGMGARFFRACLLVCPAVLLALLLAWLVIRDGTKMGLSKNARVAWVAGAMAFGLPAYITYRLTRPRVTLVTCANCGVGRRPDLEKCQRCGSPWVVPELVPPPWRVLGEPEPAEESSSSELRQANSSAQ
jgi:hypothetical protein